MCSTVLKYDPYDYREHIRYLSENFPNEGNILFRKEYSKGNCYSYQLSSFYYSSAVDIIEITDSKLLKFLAPKQVVESTNKFKKNYNFLAKYFDSSKLKIDYKSAVEQNIQTYYKELDYKKHLLNAIQVMGIANGEFKLVYCPDTDGRVHTQITRLSKKLRKFLTYEGKELAEIDISASVPTFLYFILFNQYHSSSNSHLSSIVNSSKSYCNHYMFCKSSESLDIAEISSFGQKVLDGSFYECFEKDILTIHHFDKSLAPDEYIVKNVKELLNKDFDGDMKDVRSVLKMKILSMFNAKPSKYLNEEAVFNMQFPSILRWLKKYKSENHKYLSHLTLQTESYFMLNIVTRQFNKEHQGKIPLFTLHDCLITTKENIELLFDFMTRTFKNEMGFSPILKIKNWE